MQDRTEEARALLRKVTESPEFSGSARLAQLFEYLVEESIAGRGDRLKGFTIGIDVFEKSDDFDPAKDSLVRVQMARLRSLLDEYYEGSGKEDPERFVLEKGNYEPQLETAEAVEPEEEVAPEAGATRSTALVAVEPPPMPSVRESSSWPRWVLLLVMLSALGIGILPFLRDVEDAVELAADRPEGPTVFVSPYSLAGEDETASILRDGLQYDLIANLSQLPNIGVIGFQSATGPSGDGSQDLAGVDFNLRGSIALVGDRFKVNSSLVRMRDGVVIWSDSTEALEYDPQSLLQTQADIALAVASELGQPYGVIHEAMRNDLENHRGISMENYLCELRAFEYMRSKSPERYDEVRKCLEAAVLASPDYSHAWALLSWIYGDEARQLYDPANAASASKRSVDAGRKAVEANTTSAMAYQYLAIAQFLNGDDAEALDSLDRALRLSPNNSEILADASWLLANIENNPNAIALAEKAMSLNPGHPAWYWLGPTLSALQAGDGEASLRYARLNAADSSPQSHYLLAAALQMNGRTEDARKEIEQSAVEFPEVPSRLQEMKLFLRMPESVNAQIRSAVEASRTN